MNLKEIEQRFSVAQTSAVASNDYSSDMVAMIVSLGDVPALIERVRLQTAVLRKLEFRDDEGYCFWCGSDKNDRHSSDCIISIALADLEDTDANL